jgi:hypothetical protein
MPPRKRVWLIRVLGLFVLLSVLVSPIVLASRSSYVHEPQGSGSGGHDAYTPPTGGPGPGGGGESGDPDDFSIYMNRPGDPSIIAERHEGAERHGILSGIQMRRWDGWYFLLRLMGIGR